MSASEAMLIGSLIDSAASAGGGGSVASSGPDKDTDQVELAQKKRQIINSDVDNVKTGTIQVLQSLLAPFGLG
jgi:hypothetical protein